MLSVKEIKAPIAEEMKTFEQKFKDSMKSNTALLDKITHYIIKRKGKQMRPMFVFLSAKVCGEVKESTYTAASLIELLHTATLVHDDVVDDSNQRRGFFSLNALWKNKIAVLVGDYLLSQGLLLSVDKGEFQLLRIVSNAVREMSEGELLQIEKARKLNITEDIYFDVIRQKTASLIASCCASGAASTGSSEEDIEKMRQFGEYVGIAFQIKDDLFDYGTEDKIGKPTGIDIKERKMTLPLIYALNNADRSQRRRITNIVKNHNENPEKVREVIDYVLKSGGIEYAAKHMNEYKDKALQILHTFEDNEARRSLEGLVVYTTERKK
jgi:octaprenyl-diphosphate synthase